MYKVYGIKYYRLQWTILSSTDPVKKPFFKVHVLVVLFYFSICFYIISESNFVDICKHLFTMNSHIKVTKLAGT